MEMNSTDARISELEALNGKVIRLKREAVQAMEQRNHLAYLLQSEGVSFGQLALSMGLSRSAVQGMLRAHTQDCRICEA